MKSSSSVVDQVDRCRALKTSHPPVIMERLSSACPLRDHRGRKSTGLIIACTLLALALLLNSRPSRHLNTIALLPASTRSKREPPKTLFVFLAGLEGTGHHLYAKLYSEKSSKLQDIVSDGELNLRQDLLRLQTSLYNDATPEQALFTGALAYKKKNVHPDGNQIFQSIVQQLNATNVKVLRWLEDKDSEEEGNTTTGTFPIPMNAIFVRGPFGMLSYPNYLVPARPLQYPDLHLLYRACDAAHVSCGHVYLHRDPYEVIGTC
jgi:hypothetical protein